ncbi:hypothetical protein Dvina_05625 [Dactylosporangium vinaceum]|uniref:Uncharacterized protein n=1 Tax=Dactylosporangium vinaceum TaxID=53362 RepID=A0ABV5MIH5_9ACTN|nr:hypothetical protein [Dactylosporangium vinaceum]UAB97622.1 hypothetical protein Dvina_05625 [Dactylosporangium vinaceum]
MDSLTRYWVELGELGERRRLPWGNAGNSTMWQCTFAGSRFVFKEYSDEFRASADQNALGRLIGWRDSLPDQDRAHLDRVAAWPRYRVRHNGTLLGVLMPFAPARFFREMAPDGAVQPNVIANLVRRTMDGNVIPGAVVFVKTSAIGHAADVLLWFHRQKVLVNDVRELNILCAKDGSAVHYVDCDVMIGPWGRVGSPAAPEYLQELLPSGEPPSPRIEFAKLAWVAVWILLDDFSLRGPQQAQLTRIIDAKDAELISQTGLMGPIDMENWRRMAGRWIRWTASAKVGPPPGERTVITPTPYLKPTRKMPDPRPADRSRWVPERFKQPMPAVTMPAVPVPDAPRRSHGVTVLLVAAAAVVMLVGLAALNVLLQGGR